MAQLQRAGSYPSPRHHGATLRTFACPFTVGPPSGCCVHVPQPDAPASEEKRTPVLERHVRVICVIIREVMCEHCVNSIEDSEHR